MASNAIIPLFKVHGLQIGGDKITQVQMQLKNGRRFILTGSRSTDERGLDRAMCQAAIDIIKEDKCVNLAEFTEVRPAKGSEAYEILKRKGLLETLATPLIPKKEAQAA